MPRACQRLPVVWPHTLLARRRPSCSYDAATVYAVVFCGCFNDTLCKACRCATLTSLQRPHQPLELTAQMLLRPGVLMQKEKNPENATKLLSNLVGVAGAHIDALNSQGMHDKLYFNWTAFTQPEFVTHILDYSQARQPAPSI